VAGTEFLKQKCFACKCWMDQFLWNSTTINQNWQIVEQILKKKKFNFAFPTFLIDVEVTKMTLYYNLTKMIVFVLTTEKFNFWPLYYKLVQLEWFC